MIHKYLLTIKNYQFKPQHRDKVALIKYLVILQNFAFFL